MDEQWIAAPGYEGRYEVSSLGRIRSLPRTEATAKGPRRIAGKILNPMTNPDGYLVVSLRIGGKLKTYRLHRLIALAFHGSGQNALHREVAHLDGNRANAAANNLKWVGRVENHSHRRAHGTYPIGDQAPHRILNSEQVAKIRLGKGTYTCARLGEMYGVSHYTISDIWRGKRWRSTL